MRKIKFRVFDKDFKKMRIVGADQHDSLEVDFETKKIFYYNLQNGCGSEIVPGDDSSYVLMQYTGLNDKNGKEIYEGDIVVAINRLHEDKVKQNVHYLNGCFMFGNWNSHEFFNKHQFIEVIGNIHENPELLEVGE